MPDPNDVLKRAKKSDRSPLTIYFDKELFKRFKAYCEEHDASASQVLEQLVRDFMAETAPKGRKKV